MKPIETLLVPTDFSACSAAALEHAAVSARATGAAIELLHVIDLKPISLIDWKRRGAVLATSARLRMDEGDTRACCMRSGEAGRDVAGRRRYPFPPSPAIAAHRRSRY